MDEAQAGAAQDPSKSAASTGADTPQIDLDAVTLDQLDTLMQTGTAELPVKGGEKAKEAPPVKAEDPPPKKDEPTGDEPPVVEAEDEDEDEDEETRTPEEIETAVTAAVEAVKTEGGDKAAQDAAAEAARQPVKADAAKVEPAKPKEEPEEKSRRFRVKDPIAQAALEVYKSFENTDTPITLAEAERRVRGGDAAPAKKAEDAGPNLEQVIATLDTEVTDLKTKLENAGGDEGLFTKEIAQWTQELAEKTADLKLAKRDLRDAQELAAAEAEEANTSFKELVAKSRAKAIEAYPDVADESTALGKAVAERITALRDKAHPDHSLLFTGTAPEKITRDVADELGIAPVAKKAKAAAADPPPAKKETPKPKKMTPASGAKSTAATAQPSEEATKKTVEYLKSDKASLDDLDNAFGAGDPSRMLQRVAAA